MNNEINFERLCDVICEKDDLEIHELETVLKYLIIFHKHRCKGFNNLILLCLYLVSHLNSPERIQRQREIAEGLKEENVWDDDDIFNASAEEIEEETQLCTEIYDNVDNVSDFM